MKKNQIETSSGKNNHNFSSSWQYPLHDQRQKLTSFIRVLAEKFNPLYIYCFGEAFDIASKKGCFIEGSTHGNYHYCLLLVTESQTRIEHHVQDYVNHHFHSGTITTLVHCMDHFSHALYQNDRFFITVFNNAELLYSRAEAIKSFPAFKFMPTHAAEKANKHYKQHIVLALGFLESARECRATGKYHLSIFMLHQVIEQSCIALIMVYLGYRSDIHNLYRQLRLCDSFSKLPSDHFLLDTAEGRRLFDIMVKSYSSARYKEDFCVEQTDAEVLYQSTAAFLDLASQLCLEKIDMLAAEAEIHKQFKAELCERY